MPPFWIQTDKARVAIVPRPRGGDWLEVDIEALRADGIDVLVSALSQEEVYELGLEGEAIECAAKGIEFITFPITDRGLPESRSEFAGLTDSLSDRIREGKSIGAHCRAGIGRSSVIIASVLAKCGLSADEAFERIAASRGFPVPDTAEQRAWVVGNAAPTKRD
jgi:protein-tyrosine phosphatase